MLVYASTLLLFFLSVADFASAAGYGIIKAYTGETCGPKTRFRQLIVPGARETCIPIPRRHRSFKLGIFNVTEAVGTCTWLVYEDPGCTGNSDGVFLIRGNSLYKQVCVPDSDVVFKSASFACET